MKTVDEHLGDILDAVRPLPPIASSLLESHRCRLAEDVTAPDALPAFDNSAMDGYAVRAADVSRASEDRPVSLPVVGDIPAGSTGAFAIRPGMCMRIMTGAPLPTGADTVIPVEWTDGGIAQVRITQRASAGQCIRRRGEDVEPGDVVLRSGEQLGASQVGMLAAIGRRDVLVRPRPRVAVLSTGSELAEPGARLEPGQITDANSYTLTAAAIEAGCVGYRHGIVADEPHAVLTTIEDQLLRADAIVTSGGVSMGAYDVVKEVLAELGSVRFEQVAMQPGKPQGFGLIGEDKVPIFTLPGNPVSALVSFQVFVRPALYQLQGLEPDSLPVVRAFLTAPLRSPEGKRTFARAQLVRRGGGHAVTPVGGQRSHQLADLAASNALIVVPEKVTEFAAGEEAEVMVLRS